MKQMLVQIIELVHDGPVRERLIDPRFVMVEDRAYFKIKRIDPFVVDQQHFVIRDITFQLGTTQSRSKERHRVVDIIDDKRREIHVVTNLMNVAPEVMADMYKARLKMPSSTNYSLLLSPMFY